MPLQIYFDSVLLVILNLNGNTFLTAIKFVITFSFPSFINSLVFHLPFSSFFFFFFFSYCCSLLKPYLAFTTRHTNDHEPRHSGRLGEEGGGKEGKIEGGRE